ncbi:hypothetical protein [Actinoplanes sp. NPDC051859]|uniref:hypothetical protein n=1 Tax=Actinoplanes sp. NPDC051859 TaxID=3363909 RepID=UPI00379719AD
MCLLTFLPPNVTPDLDALHVGADYNPDGHGFAVVTDSRITIGHGMTADTVIDAFVAVRRTHPGGPALFHSRLATHGTIAEANCHPFTVGGDPRTVIAHNGVLPADVQPLPGDPRSDTRITAEDLLPALDPLRSRSTRQRLTRWMTTANKMVILTVDPRSKQQAYILNEQEGVWDGGIWYSNDSYQPEGPAGIRRWWTEDEWPFEECPYCAGALDVVRERCSDCLWCLICGELPQECFCYEPDTLEPAVTAARR